MSSLAEAEIISKSPSPSKSATNMPLALAAPVEISSLVKVGFLSLLFSYQAIVLSCIDAVTISK